VFIILSCQQVQTCLLTITTAVLATGLKVCGSNPTESDEILRAIIIRSTTSFGGEVKPSGPCRMFLRHPKSPLRYGRYTDSQNSPTISRPVPSCFATRCLLQPEQRNLVDESGMIRTRMESTKIRKWLQLYGALCTIPSRNRNQ
jgi:hypothetical protein